VSTAIPIAVWLAENGGKAEDWKTLIHGRTRREHLANELLLRDLHHLLD
jgi:hypothetical protein